MQARTLNDLRAHTEAVLAEAEDEPVMIARDGKEPLVLVSRAEWDSVNATAHLLRSPANAANLMESIAELDAGHGVERELAA